MKYVIIFVSAFVLIFFISYLVQYVFKRKDKEKLVENKALLYISNKYKLKLDDKKIRVLTKIIIFNNSVIISIPVFICLISKIKYVYLLVISLMIFVVLIISSYNLIGTILKKKGW